jgi:glutamine synthetase
MDDAIAAVEASGPVRRALGEPIVGAWTAVRRADAGWADDKTPEEIIERHRWIY